jgi:hypothetical protein
MQSLIPFSNASFHSAHPRLKADFQTTSLANSLPATVDEFRFGARRQLKRPHQPKGFGPTIKNIGVVAGLASLITGITTGNVQAQSNRPVPAPEGYTPRGLTVPNTPGVSRDTWRAFPDPQRTLWDKPGTRAPFTGPHPNTPQFLEKLRQDLRHLIPSYGNPPSSTPAPGPTSSPVQPPLAY